MIEVCDYIHNGYPGLKHRIARWQLLSLLDRNPDKVICVEEEGKIRGAALYLRLEESSLVSLIDGTISLKNPKDIEYLLTEQGPHIHFSHLIANGFKTIRQGLKNIIEKEQPETVSWFDMSMRKIFVYDLKERKISCHQQH